MPIATKIESHLKQTVTAQGFVVLMGKPRLARTLISDVWSRAVTARWLPKQNGWEFSFDLFAKTSLAVKTCANEAMNDERGIGNIALAFKLI